MQASASAIHTAYTSLGRPWLVATELHAAIQLQSEAVDSLKLYSEYPPFNNTIKNDHDS